MDISSPVQGIDGTPIDIVHLDQTFGVWVHTGRNITISPSDNSYVQKKIADPNVYPISKHIRGKVILISNTGYQALRLLKDLFVQMSYKIAIFTEKTSEEMYEIVRNEAKREENKLVDSFVVVIYGTPDNVAIERITDALQCDNAPHLNNKPKLVYVIGGDTLVQQVIDISTRNTDPDILVGSTGFNGVMFFIYVFCTFVHELSAKDIWRLILQFADYHRFTASIHCTLTKEFFFFPGVSKSVLPDDLANLDPQDMTLYMKMLENGWVETYNIRLMFVGLYGAGKTSTARRIMGKEIEDVTSTDGIDVYIGKCRVDINSNTWDTVENPEHNMPYIKLSHKFKEPEGSYSYGVERTEPDSYALHKRRRLEYSTRSSSSRTSSDLMDFELLNLDSSTSSFERCDSVSECDGKEEQPPDSPNIESLNTAQRVIQEARSSKERLPDTALVSLWDFAGQFVYYATHQLFFSPRSIYLLVLNMEEDLDRTLDEWYMDLKGKESIEAQGGVHFWLSSIYTYAKGTGDGVPPIILVGTHMDKMKGNDDEKRKYAKKYFQQIRDIFHESPIADHIRMEDVLLDNSVIDSNLDQLKSIIMNVSKDMFYWGEKVPAKWVELEQALDDRRRDGTNFMKMADLKNINQKLASPLNSEDHLRLFLKIHHEIGTLIYFHDSEVLRNIIILEPQWIIHAFRHLIRAKDFGEKYGQLQKQWEEFHDTGKLNINLAESIWKQDHRNQFYENFDMLLHVLEKLDIIVRASQLQEDGTTQALLDFYYVPCLLKEPPPERILHMRQIPDGVSTPVLCFTFQENFLPPAVFNRVLALCLGRWPVARQGKNKFLFCGCAVFEVKERKDEDRHRLHIFFKKSKIGVRISRYSTKDNREVDRNVCDRVRRFVTDAVRKEFRRFQNKAIADQDPDTIEKESFFFQLQCKETNETDILDDGLHRLKDLVEDIDSDAFCSKHTNAPGPHPYDPVELLQEWFPNSIPEPFRRTNGTVFDVWLQRLPDIKMKRPVNEATMAKLSKAIGKNWWSLMHDLGVAQTVIEHESSNCYRDVAMQIFNVMKLWARKSAATNTVLLDALRKCKNVTIDWEQIQNIFDQL